MVHWAKLQVLLLLGTSQVEGFLSLGRRPPTGLVAGAGVARRQCRVRLQATADELSKLTVAQLKDRCRELGLPVGGVKAQLVDRVLGGELPQPQAEAASPKLTTTTATTTTTAVAAPKKKKEKAVALDSEEGADELDLIMSVGEGVLQEKGLGDPRKEYSRSSSSSPSTASSSTPAPPAGAPDATREAIEDLLRARAQARLERDYDKADEIRDDLEVKFGVSLFDRDGRWTDTQGRTGYYTQLNKAPKVVRPAGAASATTLSREEIQALIAERTKARRARNFQLADDLRQQLADGGIELFDQLNTWQSADGKLEGQQSEDGGYKQRWSR